MGGRNLNSSDLLFSCIACCAGCFEELVKYISKHAYIETALHNANFCKGCVESASLIFNNMFRIGVLHGITGLAVFFGILTIAALSTICGFIFMKSFSAFGSVVFETLAPLLVRISGLSKC